MKPITIGTHRTDNPANTAPIGPPPCEAWSVYSASGAVVRPSEMMNKFGQKKSFQMYWPVMIMTARCV